MDFKNFINSKNTIVIAEACDNHFGSLDNAKKMVIEAKKSGADVIKFQHHIPDEEMLPIVPRSKNFKLSLYDFLKKYSLKLKDHYELLKFTKKHKIKYLCTPFSLKAAQELDEMGVEWYKIGSGEFTDLPFIREVLKFNKPVIFSTGMSTINEIDKVYNFILKNKKNDFALMNCTSEYPPKLSDINLGFLNIMKKKYKKSIIGHSDHTNTVSTSLAASVMGAKIIEKHVYLEGKNFGPDRDVSINFKQLAFLVKSLNQIKISLGSHKKIYKKEIKIRQWARRSLFATKAIKKGEMLTKKNIWSIRPGTGIPSQYFDKLIGKKIMKSIKKGKLLEKKHINIKLK